MMRHWRQRYVNTARLFYDLQGGDLTWLGEKKKKKDGRPLSQAGTAVLVPPLRDKQQTPCVRLDVCLYEGPFIALTNPPLPSPDRLPAALCRFLTVVTQFQ